MLSRVFLASIAVLFAFAAPAQAQRMAGGETLDRILPEIRATHPGRLSDAEPWTGTDGRMHYRIKWMTADGRILYFDADARTGRFSNSGTEGGEGRYRRDDNDSRRDEGGSGDDSRRSNRSNWNGGGDWQGGDGGHRGGGDWHDRHGDGGGWRGGHGGGDNGGEHHHHGGN